MANESKLVTIFYRNAMCNKMRLHCTLQILLLEQIYKLLDKSATGILKPFLQEQ
jgi:hypothetical protein